MQTVSGLELLVLKERLHAFYHDTLLYATSSIDGTGWQPAKRIGPSSAAADLRTSSATAAVNGLSARLFWIDTRYRKSDRTAAPPLGGVPWSDDPDWANNDIFSGPVHDPGNEIRLTKAMSFARVVRAQPYGQGFVVVWSGRRTVGKDVGAAGEGPALFFTTVGL
jgi:hypothetical protein